MTQLTSGAPLASDAVDDFELEATLTAHDRCDSCGAQAYVRVTLEHGELPVLRAPRRQVQGEAG